MLRNTGVIAAVLAFLLAVAVGSASAQDFQPFVVKDIRVEGLQRTEPGTVFSYLPVKVGETMNADKARAALRALYATGFFQDVRLEVENDVLVVFVRERPAIAQIDFSGMKEFDADTVRKVLRDLGMAEGRIFDTRDARLRRAGAQAPVPVARHVRRRGADHRHAPRAQPRRHQHRRDRGRGGQDPRHQHRRRAGLSREGAARPVRAAHAGLAHLVHQARPLCARAPGRRPRAAALVLPQPRLSRLQPGVDAGVDHPRPARHLHHGQHRRRRDLQGGGGEPRRADAAAARGAGEAGRAQARRRVLAREARRQHQGDLGSPGQRGLRLRQRQRHPDRRQGQAHRRLQHRHRPRPPGLCAAHRRRRQQQDARRGGAARDAPARGRVLRRLQDPALAPAHRPHQFLRRGHGRDAAGRGQPRPGGRGVQREGEGDRRAAPRRGLLERGAASRCRPRSRNRTSSAPASTCRPTSTAAA